MDTKQLEEYFIRTEKDGLTLTIPSHSSAGSNEAWTKDNLWLRSRIETAEGRTVSQGFGKFFNLGQGPDDLRVDAHDVVEAVRAGRRVVATFKHDGSCLIRSVYDGKVIFRTRGSFSYEHHDKADEELQQFLQEHPKLNDPKLCPDMSLLFEWVTPENQIVVKYNEPKLYLIGGVYHDHGQVGELSYVTTALLSAIAYQAGVELTECIIIDSVEDWERFYSETLAHKEIEGYVLRLDDEQTLVKVKAEAYVIKHGLKSNLSYKNMVEFWLQHGRVSGELLVKQLEDMYDEEVVMWALPFVAQVEDAIDEWEKTYGYVRQLAVDWQHASRKDFAITMQKKLTKLEFGLAMLLWENPDREIEDRMIRNFMKQFDKADIDGD